MFVLSPLLAEPAEENEEITEQHGPQKLDLFLLDVRNIFAIVLPLS